MVLTIASMVQSSAGLLALQFQAPSGMIMMLLSLRREKEKQILCYESMNYWKSRKSYNSIYIVFTFIYLLFEAYFMQVSATAI